MARVFLTISLLACVACGSYGDESSGGATVVLPCHLAGCSSEICSDRGDVVSACMWLPEYACYRNATCAPQGDGSCAWTQTPELVACLQAAR